MEKRSDSLDVIRVYQQHPLIDVQKKGEICVLLAGRHAFEIAFSKNSVDTLICLCSFRRFTLISASISVLSTTY